MNPLSYFLLFFKATLFSINALGNLPGLQRDLLARKWATTANFSEALAIGQISPGSNGLWAVSLGYLTYGLPGAVLALLAIAIPPFLIIPLAGIYRRIEHQPWAQAIMRALGFASIGFLLSAAWSIFSVRLGDWTALAICLASFALCFYKKIGSLPVLLAAAGAGFLLYR
jgi:chromate transporter